MQGGKVSAKDLAKVVWRLRAIPAQAVEDFRCHRRHREMPTSVLRRFIEQQRLLWSNRIGGVDYYNLGLSDPRLPMEMKRSYIGRFQSWRVFCALNPAEHPHLLDRTPEFRAEPRRVGNKSVHRY